MITFSLAGQAEGSGTAIQFSQADKTAWVLTVLAVADARTRVIGPKDWENWSAETGAGGRLETWGAFGVTAWKGDTSVAGPWMAAMVKLVGTTEAARPFGLWAGRSERDRETMRTPPFSPRTGAEAALGIAFCEDDAALAGPVNPVFDHVYLGGRLVVWPVPLADPLYAEVTTDRRLSLQLLTFGVFPEPVQLPAEPVAPEQLPAE